MGPDEGAWRCMCADKNKATMANDAPAIIPIRTSGDFVCMGFLLSSFFPQ
jgi:hypothetical protein